MSCTPRGCLCSTRCGCQPSGSSCRSRGNLRTRTSGTPAKGIRAATIAFASGRHASTHLSGYVSNSYRCAINVFRHHVVRYTCIKRILLVHHLMVYKSKAKQTIPKPFSLKWRISSAAHACATVPELPQHGLLIPASCLGGALPTGVYVLVPHSRTWVSRHNEVQDGLSILRSLLFC